MTVTIGDLAAFAAAAPADAAWDNMRREGLRSGYPACCVEFYVAIIGLVWSNLPGAAAYWTLAGKAGRGYVLCPACLGVPVTELLG